MIRSLSDKKFRDRTGLFIVEGEKLVEEALRSGFIVEKLYRRDEIGDAAMQRISATVSGSPVLALVRKPLDIKIEVEDSCRNALGSSGLFIALDSIRDPGNLGTILRIADWFNVKAVFASPDTVDIFNPKVVQATMGAIFRVKFHYAPIPMLCDIVKYCGGEVYGTFLDGCNIYEQELECGIDRPSLIVIGNESNGISDEVGAKATGRLLIPRYKEKGSESLNAAIATAITVAEFRRRTSDTSR
ncbi:MAG: TrmH family RNA methyltransferase [Candidatus Cryptobacteroides sp.]